MLTLAAFMTFLSVLTLGIDALSADKRHPEMSNVNILLIGAVEHSQGITVLEAADGAVFHAIDMGPLFLNAFIRSYAPVEEG